MTSQPPQPPGGYGDGHEPVEDERRPDGGQPASEQAQQGPEHLGYGQPPGLGQSDHGQQAPPARPQQGQPGWGQPPYGQPGQGEPHYGQQPDYPQYGYPQYGQPQDGQPGYHGFSPSYDPPGYGVQYPAAQYPGAQYPGAQYPGAQYPGAQYPQQPYAQPQYGQHPWGQPGPGQPGHGAQPYAQQSYAQQPYAQQFPAQQPYGQPSARPSRGPHVGLDRRRLDLGDVLVALSTVVFLLFAALPWFTFDFGFGLAESINGFDFGLVTTAAVLLVLAALWSLLPAVVDLALPFPRAIVTAGLASSALLLTLVEWLTSFEGGFSPFALLTLLAAAAALASAVFALLRQLRHRTAVPGGWVAQPPGQPWPQAGHPAAYGQHPVGRPTGAEEPPPGEQSRSGPPVSGSDRDDRPGGSTASGAGPGASA